MQQVDAWVIVGTKLDTKKLEKDLKSAENKLKRYEKEAEKLTKAQMKVEVDLEPYKEEQKRIAKSYQETLKSAATLKQKEYDKGIIQQELDNLNTKYSQQIKMHEEINKKIQENAKNQALVKNEIDETNKKLIQARGYENIKEITEKIGKSTTNVIKKMGRWALSIFGIRSAYMGIRNALNVIAGNDAQLRADIDYIKNIFAYSLEPIVRTIVDLVKQLMIYIAYISEKWTGTNIFENANKSLKNANNNANKLKKTLAGFDEMNVLGDQSGTGGGLPSFDLSKTEGKMPSWVQWIADNKDLFTNITKALLLLFGVTTTNKVLNGIAKMMGASDGMGLIGLKETLAIIGTTYVIAFATKGLVEVIRDIKQLNKDLDSIKEQTKVNSKNNKELANSFFDMAKNGELATDQIDSYQAMLDDSIYSSMNFIDQLESQKNWLGSITGANEKLTDTQYAQADSLRENLNIYKQLYEQGLLSEEQEKQYKKALAKSIQFLEKYGEEAGDLKQQLKDLVKDDYEVFIKTKFDASEAINGFSNFFNKVGKSISAIFGSSNGNNAINNIKNIWSGRKLATGGIVNMPGKGVPIGGAVTGEVRKEGVIPLTDTQAMMELGQTIGRYITVNNHITTTLNGRVIGRELQKSNAESDFAFNK